MAKVFRGTDTVLGRTVAIKVLAPQFSDDEAFVQRFRREAQAAARISHPAIVSVFDTGSDDGLHYIVMEFVEGRTLAQVLAEGGRIMPDRALAITREVTRALEAAHAQGVIHRDIKPGNIMLNPRGEVKVTDFGIARMTTSAETIEQTAAILGTASYLSPEQAQGQPVDGRSDIYSLGCVLYEMVTGRPPFLGDSPVTVASKQVLEQPVPPSKLNPDVTPDLDAVILRTLAKNPANRYGSAAELREDLERVSRGLPVDAPPVLEASATRVIDRPAERTAVLPFEEVEPERRSPWVPVAVTLILIGLLGGVLWFLAATLLGGDDQQTPVLIEVPSLIGERQRAAEELLREAGLEVGEITKVPPEDETQVPGTVIDQDPAAGSEVEEGTPVDLVVVGQPELVAVPDIPPGSTLEQARAALLEVGLVPAGPEEQPSTEIDVGLVIGTVPAAGTEVEPGSEVVIIVSSGPDTVVVPEVRCLSFNAALNRLEKEGLNGVISDDTVAINPSCPLGNKVADQDPAPGTEVEPGSTVTLFAGEEPIPTGGTGPTGPTGDG
jgi:serine/threonine-protein kinase